ncbi:transferase [Klebsiella pneumoniae]|nr:transferase [Klebsiella pneumoniae]
MRKYRLSEQTRQYCYEEEHGKQSVTLRQIVALIDFADVKAGSEGGWGMRNALSASRGSAGSTMSTAWSSPGRASATTPANRVLRGQP